MLKAVAEKALMKNGGRYQIFMEMGLKISVRGTIFRSQGFEEDNFNMHDLATSWHNPDPNHKKRYAW